MRVRRESIEEALESTFVEAGWPPFCRLPPPALVIVIGKKWLERVRRAVEGFSIE